MPKEQKFREEERKTDRPVGFLEGLADAPKDAERLRYLKKRIGIDLIEDEPQDRNGNKIGYSIKEKGKDGKILYFEDYNLKKREADAAEQMREEMKVAREHDLDDALLDFDGPEN